MKKEFVSFKQEMDGWVKDFNTTLENYSCIPTILDESIQNIDHNYELIQDMHDEMQKLREEITALKVVQLLHLREIKRLQTKPM